jgi:Class III cytochrome C family
MPMKRLLIVLSLFLLAAVAWAADAPETVDLSPYAKVTAPSKFDHKLHVETNKVDCTKCHHKWDGATGQPQKCSVCHHEADSGGAPSAKDAFHALCKNCHKEKRKEGKKSPTSCTGCHVKS